MAFLLFGCIMLSVTSSVQTVYPEALTGFVGLNFKQILKKDAFFPSQKNIKFTVSLDGLPDLPSWLKLDQKDGLSDAMLYGTPDPSNVGTVKLEVIAWSKETYETKRTVSLLTVVDLKDSNVAVYKLEFLIRNKNLHEFLLEDFTETVKKVWPNADYMTFVEKETERRGGIYPLPGNKEGVYATIGGNLPIPINITNLKSICASVSSENFVVKTFQDAGYDINWCLLNNVVHNSIVVDNTDTGFLQTDAFEPATLETQDYKNRPQYLTTDVVYVFIPVAIGLSLIVILTCSMCFVRDQSVTRGTFLQKPLRNDKNKDIGTGDKIKKSGFVYGNLNDEKAGLSHNVNTKMCNGKNINSIAGDVEKGRKPPPYRNPPKTGKWNDSNL